MKRLSIIIALFILALGTTSWAGVHGEKMVIAPGSTEIISPVIPLANSQMVVEIKRGGVFRTFKRSGKLVIRANNCVVEVINFYRSSRARWRKFIINMPNVARNVEIWNDTGVKIKVRNIQFIRHGFSHGGANINYEGYAVDGILSILIENAIVVRDFIDLELFKNVYLPLKVDASECLALLESKGESSSETRNCLQGLEKRLQDATPTFKELMEIPGLSDIAQSYLFSAKMLERSLR